jgi:hypothetical protein
MLLSKQENKASVIVRNLMMQWLAVQARAR